jgi:hypothetical protein
VSEVYVPDSGETAVAVPGLVLYVTVREGSYAALCAPAVWFAE